MQLASKITVSIDLALSSFIDSYRAQHKNTSCSQVVSEALLLLQQSETERMLEWAYTQSAQEDALVNAQFASAQTDGLAHEAW
jgi:Arc/MetJ-type ribon-helix-helix transcriptional regulator